jgi:cytochrome c-type biogenesis protein CcmH/NrfF
MGTGTVEQEPRVSALAWWLIPLIATILAVAFVALRSRPEKPSTPDDGMDRMRRMQQAMERPLPGTDPDRPRDEA